MTGTLKNSNVTFLIDDMNRILLSLEKKKGAWQTYIRNLLSDNRPQNCNLIVDEEGPDILPTEVGIESFASGKSPGPDGVRSEYLKFVNHKGVLLLTKLFNLIYRSGEIPREWLKLVFVTIPKTQNAKKCNQFQTISLMSHVLKIFLRIIYECVKHNRELH